MTNRHLISVIIPIYNRDNFLETCINSVIDQINVATEIILVDDGSTDNSGLICDTYAQKHSNIKVIHTENHGLSHARNIGLDIAGGDYIFFLDSDDSLVPDTLISLQNALEENDADYSVGNLAIYLQNGSLKSVVQLPDKYANKLLDASTAVHSLIDIDFPLFEVVIGKLFKKEIWDTIRFPIGKTAEDCFVLKDLLSRCNRIFFLDKVIYKLVLTESSITRSPSGEHMLCSVEANGTFVNYLISIGSYDVALVRFGHGSRQLIKCKRELQDAALQAEIRRIYKSYCDICQRFAPHVSLKNKIRFFIFRINLTLYGFIRDTMADNS